MRLYHFSNMLHLPEIVESGVLRTTESNADLRVAHAAPDVVWFVDTPTLDADHGLTAGLAAWAESQGMAIDPHTDKRRVRITVDLPDYRVERWTDWADRHGVDDVTRATLIATGGGPEAASHWWVTERPVPRKWWKDISMAERVSTPA